jgi:hypothetical protein
MPHAIPTRSAHRAPGGLALLVRRVAAATNGHQRRSAERAVHLTLRGLGALILLGIVGLSTFFVVAEQRRGAPAESTSTPPSTSPAAISSRLADPKPLSLAEIFPGGEIKLAAGAEPYRVSMTHIDTDCDIATTGALGQMLAEGGCTQVVRAEMIAPYGGYEVTAGIFNLADESGAAQVGEQLSGLIRGGGGTFATMAAGSGPGSNPAVAPRSRAGWQERGHYLVFCVITRPDDNPVSPDDPYARRIIADLLITYLSDEKLGARALNL